MDKRNKQADKKTDKIKDRGDLRKNTFKKVADHNLNDTIPFADRGDSLTNQKPNRLKMTEFETKGASQRSEYKNISNDTAGNDKNVEIGFQEQVVCNSEIRKLIEKRYTLKQEANLTDDLENESSNQEIRNVIISDKEATRMELPAPEVTVNKKSRTHVKSDRAVNRSKKHIPEAQPRKPSEPQKEKPKENTTADTITKKPDKESTNRKPDREPCNRKLNKEATIRKPDIELSNKNLDSEATNRKLDNEATNRKPDRVPSNRKLDKELANRKPDKELSNKKLDKEATNRKTYKELNNKKLDKEATNRKPDGELSNRKLEKEATNRKPDGELSNRKLDKEATNRKPDGELTNRKLDKEATNRKPDGELTNRKLDKEATNRKPDGELSNRKLDKEATNRKPDGELSNRKLDKEATNRKPDGELSNRKLDKESTNRKPDRELSNRKMDKEATNRKLDKEATNRKLDKESSHRKPIIKTVTSKNTSKTFKAVTFGNFRESKSQPKSLRINIPNNEMASKIIRPNSKVSKSTETVTLKPKTRLASNKGKPDIRRKIIRKLTRKSGSHSPDSYKFRDNKSPPTEVAKWAPSCMNKHTKPYYEAWVNTTLAAISRSSKKDKLFLEKRSIIQSFQRALEERAESPELVYEKLKDEKYTGRIKVNSRRR